MYTSDVLHLHHSIHFVDYDFGVGSWSLSEGTITMIIPHELALLILILLLSIGECVKHGPDRSLSERTITHWFSGQPWGFCLTKALHARN